MNRQWTGNVWVGAGTAYFVHTPLDDTLHAHALLQIAITLQAAFTVVDERGQALHAEAAVIGSHQRHGLHADAKGSGLVLSLFLEPNSNYGRALRAHVARTDAVATPLDAPTAAALRTCWTRPAAPRGALLVHEVMGVLAGPALPRVGDDRRVAFAQDYIAHHLADSDALDHVAGQLRLTTRYLRKLFERNVGLSPQRYRQWCKLRAALEFVMQGSSFTTAAAMAGFTDSAHFSRTFRGIFGAPPSTLLSTRAVEYAATTFGPDLALPLITPHALASPP